MKNETQLIRFVTELDHLIDDIKNGFKLTKHNIDFETTALDNLWHLLDFLKENNKSNPDIEKLQKLKDTSKGKEHFDNLVLIEITTDPMLGFRIKSIISGFRFKPYMKCFTEVRHNQKIHKHHSDYFGMYGISLTKEWGIRNNASPVIYLEAGTVLSKRIGLILSMLKTMSKGIEHEKAILDLLSLVEHSQHSFEFEWRILGPNNYLDSTASDEPPRISFNFADVIAIYVQDSCQIESVRQTLEEIKQANNDPNEIPEILITESIILSNEEVQEIQNIHKRR